MITRTEEIDTDTSLRLDALSLASHDVVAESYPELDTVAIARELLAFIKNG